MRQRLCVPLVVVLLLSTASTCAAGEAPDPKQLLQNAIVALGKPAELRLEYDVETTNRPVEDRWDPLITAAAHSTTNSVIVRRPNMLSFHTRSRLYEVRVVFDGKQVYISRGAAGDTTTPVSPSSIEELLLRSRRTAIMLDRTLSWLLHRESWDLFFSLGRDFKCLARGFDDGVECDRVAFVDPDGNRWEAWISRRPPNHLRRTVITRRYEMGFVDEENRDGRPVVTSIAESMLVRFTEQSADPSAEADFQFDDGLPEEEFPLLDRPWPNDLVGTRLDFGGCQVVQGPPADESLKLGEFGVLFVWIKCTEQDVDVGETIHEIVRRTGTADARINLVMMYSGEAEAARKFIADNNLQHWPVSCEPDLERRKAWQLSARHAFVIDPNGMICWSGPVGSSQQLAVFQQALRKALEVSR